MNITAIATSVDTFVHRDLHDPFEMDARLYGIETSPSDNDDGSLFLALGENRDPYELLWETDKPTQALDAIALVVTGYASPNDGDEDMRPSQHPDRIRVRIVACKGKDGFTTVMRRSDSPDTVEFTGEDCVGNLRDEIEEAWAQWHITR